MCRGLAVGVDIVTNEVICVGKSSHTDTIGNREDNCIKLEIIVNEESEKGFYVELDEQYFVNGKLEKKIKEKFGKWLTASEGMSEKLNRIIEDWIENNKLQIYKWLLFCQSYHKGEKIYNSHQEGEKIYNNSQKGKKIDNSYQEGEEIYNSYQEGEKIYIAFTKTGIQEISDWIKTKSEENTQLTLADLVQIIINFENKDN